MQLLQALGHRCVGVSVCPFACVERVLEANPGDATAWGQKGAVLTALGRPEEALACCEEALDRCPDAPWLWHNKGVALDTLGRAAEAATTFERARRSG